MGAAAPGMASDAWQTLYRAAETYATRHLHVGIEFPCTDTNAVCPLCLQHLEDAAKRRLEAFREYMSGAAEATFREATARAKRLTEVVDGLTVPRPDVGVLGELDERYPGTRHLAESVVSSIESRLTAVRAAICSGQWDAFPAVDEHPLGELRNLQGRLTSEAEECVRLADPSAREVLRQRRAFLAARVEMARHRSRLEKHVVSLSRAARIASVHGGINTNAITVKGREIADKVLTDSLLVAFRNELSALDLSKRLSVTIGRRGERGRSLYGVKLVNARFSSARRSQILSEGEQRVVALCYFVAESVLAEGRSGLVIDDPVSSVDEVWSDEIARRLVQLGSDRQVIVFTHNVFFYLQLEQHATELRVPVHRQFLARLHGVPGVCDDIGAPSEKLGLNSRLAWLDTEIRKCRKDFEAVADARVLRTRVTYLISCLRAAWERAVEEHVLNRVVERFGNTVKTQSLRGVICDDDTYKDVYDAMTRLSGLTPAHDHASRVLEGVLTPETLVKELEALRAFAKVHKTKVGEVERRRKQLHEPPPPLVT